MLPEEAGYVVHLEAPYGYGKSVLATQWAEELEFEGWRVVWLALSGRDLRRSLASSLNFSEDTPWGIVLDSLWRVPSVLVLEDVTGDEALEPLLKDVRGLLLLASRQSLAYPSLLSLMTSGRLVRVEAKHLAFSELEAEALFDDEAQAKLAWGETQGWPLPLHLSALTGGVPNVLALLKGVKASISAAEWQELLFLAALPQLPCDYAVVETKRLAQYGLLQSLASAFRLHPMLAEAVCEHFAAELKLAVMAKAERLDVLLRGVAFEACGHDAGLLAILECTEAELWMQDAAQIIAWDACLPGPVSARRHLSVGSALAALRRTKEGCERLRLAVDVGGLSVNEELRALADLCWNLAFFDVPQAYEVIAEGDCLVDAADAEQAARFLNNSYFVYFRQKHFAEAKLRLDAAAKLYPADNHFAFLPILNKAEILWEEKGDLQLRLWSMLQHLEAVKVFFPIAYPILLEKLAFMYLWLDKKDEAKSFFEALIKVGKEVPLAVLKARAVLAFLNSDCLAFSVLVAQAKLWKDEATLDFIYAYWLKTLRSLEDYAAAEVLYGSLDRVGVYVKLEYAVCLSLLARQAEALALLATVNASEFDREFRLSYQASVYLVTGQKADLAVFLGLCGERVLPGFMALPELPRDQAELSNYYPLKFVLASGWQQAIEHRFNDIPDLEVTVLDGFSIRLLGKELDLTERQKELLALLLLGCERDAVGEALWPEVSEKKMRNNMAVQIAHLRKVLEPWGLPTYLMNYGLAKTKADLWQLQAALKDNRPDEVMHLYQGSFAAGVDLCLVTEAREQLMHEVIACLFEASQIATDDKAGVYLEKLLQLEPLHEEALQALLKLLMARGRRREAKRRFDGFAKLLLENFDAEPLAKTTALLQHIEPDSASFALA